MAIPERDTVYTNDGVNRTVYTRPSGNNTGWIVGGIVAIALVLIGYMVYSANSNSSTSVNIDNPAVTAPATDPAIMPAPMTEAPAVDTNTAPMVEAPATDAAPVTEAPAVEAPAPATPAPAADPAAPVTTP